jgi:hypothetical protein
MMNKAESRKKFAEALSSFASASSLLTSAWYDLDPQDETVPIDGYPFSEDFHEMSLRISEWADKTVGKLGSMNAETVIGKKVRLIRTSDPYTRLRSGAVGTVNFVDDFHTMFVEWEDGSSLGLIQGEDSWEFVNE